MVKNNNSLLDGLKRRKCQQTAKFVNTSFFYRVAADKAVIVVGAVGISL